MIELWEDKFTVVGDDPFIEACHHIVFPERLPEEDKLNVRHPFRLNPRGKINKVMYICPVQLANRYFSQEDVLTKWPEFNIVSVIGNTDRCDAIIQGVKGCEERLRCFRDRYIKICFMDLFIYVYNPKLMGWECKGKRMLKLGPFPDMGCEIIKGDFAQ